ncbi:unnamed protein product [Rotaria sordida]|uniref:E3 ubiquitin-protein ligase RBBP6 n=1 Tax=Rotaria sordida TaxID=392033 RepID=A0A814I7B2_9BILA|nr:unnamed protein product [Rotaria sordida]CAF1249814.1 unnamed protein product [Rotaria sordida]
MAKTMSIIRYKYKADRDFESVQFEGMSCSLGELKRLIVERSSRSGTHHPRDDYDLIISNATTHEEYKDNSDMIPRNTSVVVARRIRGVLESLTPASNQKPIVSSDDIVNEYLRPAIFQPTQLTIPSTTNTSSSSSSSIIESKAIPLEMLTQSSNNTATQEMSEDERIKEVVKTSQSRYLTSHRSNTSYTCHNCKQPGHIRNQCPLLLQSSSTNSTGNATGSSLSSGGDHTSKTDGTQSIGSGSTTQPVPHPSHIVTHQSPYQLSYHHNNHYHGNRSHHRGSGHPRNEPLPKKTTGIPRDGLIQIPRHIPGAFRDQTGAPVVPRQMAQLIIEKSEKKADALAQRARQFQEKGVLPPAPPPSMLPTKSTDEDTPPDDLLCPVCIKVYTDAVITPCCHNSFCDECIRTALVESEDHECPHCHRQHVAIDQINPNLFLRKHVNRWREERQLKSSYPYMPLPQQTSIVNYSSSQTLEQDLDSTSTRTSGLINVQNSDDVDEYDEAILSTVPQQSVVPVKTAPIVIKMQPIGRSPSPQPIVSTRPADMTFEDGKAPDTDQTTSSQKDVNSELSATNNNIVEEILNTKIDTNASENEKPDRQTPPSQVAPVSAVLSSPPTATTTMASTASVVPYYHPAPPRIPPHQQHVHHGVMYSQPGPPTSSTGLYPIQHNFYPSPMHVPYSGVHHSVGAPPILPVGGIRHYPSHPSFPAGLPAHHYPLVPSHVQPNPINGFHVAHFEAANVSSLHHPNTPFAATSTSTSTLIAHNHHHQTAAQPISTPLASALSKDEFYMKQRYLQRIQRSSSRHRTRSRSSSYSSSTSTDSRSSSFSRRDDHRHRRSSRSRSRRRTSVRRRDDSRTKSPNRDSRRQRRRSTRSNSKQRRSSGGHRSPSYRNRRRAPTTNEKYSSNYRRPSPRPYRSTRNRERRRSPRPPPTIQQSTQRTIVYMHESSSSKQNSDRNHHRTKSRSRHRSQVNDDRIAPSSKTEEQSQSKSTLSTSPMTVPLDQQHTTLSSTIKPVIEENLSAPLLSNSSDYIQSTETNSMNQSNDTTEEKNSNSEKKRKKHHHHHKKHRRHRSKSPNSKSKKRHHSKDNDTETIVKNTMTNSTPVIETQ